MRYNSIKDFDIKQGDGINVSLWTQGCSHRCKGCHNPETWDFKGGKPFTLETASSIIDLLTKDKIHKNLSILGGEPLEKVNFKQLADLIAWVKMFTKAKVWVWTGYEFETLLKQEDEDLKFILGNIDYLVDGKFIEKCKVESRYKGSRNQRVIDINASMKKGEIVVKG